MRAKFSKMPLKLGNNEDSRRWFQVLASLR
jgi:hypothetical protein